MQRMCFAVLKQLISACRRCIGDHVCIVRPRCLNIEFYVHCVVDPRSFPVREDGVQNFPNLHQTFRRAGLFEHLLCFQRNPLGLIRTAKLQ